MPAWLTADRLTHTNHASYAVTTTLNRAVFVTKNKRFSEMRGSKARLRVRNAPAPPISGEMELDLSRGTEKSGHYQLALFDSVLISL
jgi:hypothetical protein